MVSFQSSSHLLAVSDKVDDGSLIPSPPLCFIHLASRIPRTLLGFLLISLFALSLSPLLIPLFPALEYTRNILVTQLVKNLPAMRETWV